MELTEGKIYLCADNEVRRLDEVETDYFHYSVPIDSSDSKLTWLRLSKTHRHQVEKDFTDGRIISESEIINA